MRSRWLFWGLVCLIGLALTGCAPSNGLPVSEEAPDVTLPPAEVNYAAPIGDASLEYTETATLYLPSHDGISLTSLETQITYSPVRPRAESLMRALLSQAGDKNVTSLGGSVRLSLYGISPVEVSRDVVTVKLSASALQLDRSALFLVCQAIANTLTTLPEIQYVNVLVVDKAVGVDVANTLPMGAFHFSDAADLGAVYEQLLSRRVGSAESAENKPFSATVPLYFPLSDSDAMVSEARSMTFENQVVSDMVTSILRQLGDGPRDETIHSPSLPLLADLLTAKPSLYSSEETGGNILLLDFAHNLEDMLDAYGISQKQCAASLCYTFCTFLPNVSGISLSINGTPVDTLLMTESETADLPPSVVRADFSDRLYDFGTLFLPDETGRLQRFQRPMPYRQAKNPRYLLIELAKGPQPGDSVAGLQAIVDPDALTDTSLLGFSLSDHTVLVNLSPSFAREAGSMTTDQERALAYAMVNTLCEHPRIRSVCFFQSGSQFDGLGGEIYWRGLFYPLR